MNDVEVVVCILKGLAFFGCASLMYHLLGEKKANKFLALLIAGFMLITYAKSLSERIAANNEAAANAIQREVLTALQDVSSDDDDGDTRDESEEGWERCDIPDYMYNDYEALEEHDEIRINEYHAYDDSVGIGTEWDPLMTIMDYELWYEGMRILGEEGVRIKRLVPPASATNHYEIIDESFFPSNSIASLPFIKIKGYKDTDHDGLSDEDELLWGTDLENPDSDNDGLLDGDEVENSDDPTNSVIDDVDDESDQESELMPIPGQFFTISGEWESWDEDYDPSTNQQSQVSAMMSLASAEDSNSIDDPAGIGYQSSWRNPFVYHKTGKTFVPTRTGYYAFRIDADDIGTLTVGPVVAQSTWPNPGVEVKGLFVAGESYPISITLVNNGGPVSIISRKFGEYTPVKLADLQTSMSASATVYEKAYYDEGYRKEIEHNATPVVFRLKAHGGPFGGIVRFQNENGEALYCQKGDNLLDGVKMIEPQAELKCACVLGGKAPSSSHEDILIRTILTENRTGNAITNDHRITSVGLTITADSNITDKHRHVFGPLENVTLASTITNSYVNWKLNGMPAPHSNGVWRTRGLSLPGSANCVLEYNGCGLKFKLRTIAPTRRYAFEVRRNSANSWNRLDPSMFTPPPIELWCCMEVVMGLWPDYVSFEKLRVREDACPAVGCKGCFTNMVGTTHNPGPLSIMTVGSHNLLSNPDFAGKHGVVTTNGNELLWGEYRWEIPVKWQTMEDDSDEWRELKHKDTQIFNLTNGILSVSKFGQTSRRTRIVINNTQENNEEIEDE